MWALHRDESEKVDGKKTTKGTGKGVIKNLKYKFFLDV